MEKNNFKKRIVFFFQSIEAKQNRAFKMKHNIRIQLNEQKRDYLSDEKIKNL